MRIYNNYSHIAEGRLPDLGGIFVEISNLLWLVPIASLQMIHVYSVLTKGWTGDKRKYVIFDVL